MRTDHKKVPGFPKVIARVAEDGTATVTINGVSHPISGDGLSDTRSAIIGFIASTAEKLGRPVRARTVDSMGEWDLIVYQDGLVESDTSVEPPKGKNKKASVRSRNGRSKPKRSLIGRLGGTPKSAPPAQEDETTPRQHVSDPAEATPEPPQAFPQAERPPAPTETSEVGSSRVEGHPAPPATERNKEEERPPREEERGVGAPPVVPPPEPAQGTGDRNDDVSLPEPPRGPGGPAGHPFADDFGRAESPPAAPVAQERAVPRKPPPAPPAEGDGGETPPQGERETTPPPPAGSTNREHPEPGTGDHSLPASPGNPVPTPSPEPADRPSGHFHAQRPEPAPEPNGVTNPWEAAIQENNQKHDPTGAYSTTAFVASPTPAARPRERTGGRPGVFRRLLSGGSAADEIGETEFASRIQVPIPVHRRIAVLSLKGGVGKTTTAVLLGSVFASTRESRVIAVDANPDRGTLRDRFVLQSGLTLRELSRDAASIDRYTQVRQYVSVNESRLHALVGAEAPVGPNGMDADSYKSAASLLEQYYDIALTDCGTGLNLPGMGSVLSLTDQVVIVLEPALDAARSAHSTLSWLSQNGYRHLADQAIVVISRVERKAAGSRELAELESQFRDLVGGVVRIPFDEHLAKGGIVRLDKLRERTRAAYRKLALLSAEGLARLG
ncbi:MinD/ParA family ATP-binding protein [Nocardiopsis halotolerans]|uniref:MinD/ParA family ATP-binding protein n=1 Tax=Nocardiopsis halotolerans TaxID=124252 RepID=UPI00034D6ABA|nr:MinD/ParA family protein [Nocardiopsis halotolerans]